MKRLLIVGLVFGCSATGAGSFAHRDVARADAPDSTPGSAPAAAAGTGRVIVDVYGLKEQRGDLDVAIYQQSEGFPKDRKAALIGRSVPINNRALRLTFDRVPAGDFAVAAYHDENANGKLDTGAFGMPTEGYGFSRDAKGNFGPPSFKDARLTLDEGRSVRVVVHLRY